MNTTFSSYDDALEALSQIGVWEKDVASRVEFLKGVLNVPGLSEDAKQHWVWKLEELTETFQDNIAPYADIAKREIDENPWLKEVDPKFWRREAV